MGIQRPGRPTARAGQPARPATGPLPKAAPATSRARAAGSSTRSVQKQGSSRPVPKQAAPKSSSTMMIAIGAGVVVLLGIAAFAMSGESKKVETPAAKPPSKPKAVDVSAMERDGMAKCDQGLKLIQKHSDLMAAANLSDGQKSTLKGDLEQGRKLISDGMALLSEASDKSGNKYPNMNQYQEALIIARRKLMTLRD